MAAEGVQLPFQAANTASASATVHMKDGWFIDWCLMASSSPTGYIIS